MRNKYLYIFLFFLFHTLTVHALDLTRATIVYDKKDAALVKHLAAVLADDVERITGVRPAVSTKKSKGSNVILATTACTSSHKELRGSWERYAIDTHGNTLSITGSDPRGLAYGVFHVSEEIGVNPWYWFADIVVKQPRQKAENFSLNAVSKSPTVKYRGLFINDEDWGLKTWAANNYEKELGDIGPKTYDRVCELILRLKGNMLAPAMHSCTGAFYSHPESQEMADKWGIMITTSHCEPLLFNNASLTEWDRQRDGEWNYETNRETILSKLDRRISETSQYDNIYTMGMRGLHDEAMKGSTSPNDRARTLEKVFDEQRNILERYKHQRADRIKQIFVPYKETLDIYDAGLRVPDDITIVWPDDNYGYMKRVSNEAERNRKGGSGVYYHLSYLGTPHDNLWIATTSPQLMYEELLKAYTAGADRYWLLNVGDIKPMEIETQMFFDMAFDFSKFSYDNANRYQAEWLASLFGSEYKENFQYILDNYYRLAWQRKPEFMGYEMEWDSEENNRLHDTDFSFEKGTAQKRLVDYQNISYAYQEIENSVASELRPALFEILGYAVQGAYQMNRKFLYAQANHETGNKSFASQSVEANNQLEALRKRYSELFDGKWDYMISEIPPGFCAKYQMMPELVDYPTDAYRLPAEQIHPEFDNCIDLSGVNASAPFRLLEGLGKDWVALQMGQPLDRNVKGAIDIDIPESFIHANADSIEVAISVLPMWPVATDCSNRFAVSIDGGEKVVCENVFIEWGKEWKLQVLENRKDFVMTFPLDKSLKKHRITLSIIDSGQIVQGISFRPCMP